MDMERIRIADELYQISKMGMEAAEIILPKVRSRELKEQLAERRDNFRSFANRSREILEENGASPGDKRKMRERFLRGYVDIGTLLNRSSEHISQMMISGTLMGMMDISRAVNHNPDDSLESIQLAEEYLSREQQYVDRMSKYL